MIIPFLPTPTYHILPPLLPQFTHLYPSLTIHLHHLSLPHHLHPFLNPQIDIPFLHPTPPHQELLTRLIKQT
ncbi:LysR substrate-binding domain-containing protein, partial [Bacillus sp. WP8]|uniref:LysR substrate-binding domain-containing protein n=1 Tax=Bacillus sp. WP8 TaxID=756828 RepID=UPI0037BF91A2